MIDVIFISDAKTPELAELTKQAIETAKRTKVPLNIIVLERAEQTYSVRTIHMSQDFNYNRYANYGASLGCNKYILISNNDVIFHDNWAEELIKADYPVMSPYEPSDWRMQNVQDREQGYEIGKHLAGWCFIIKRETWEQIGHFDESFTFWFSDNAIAKQLEAINTPVTIIKSAVVEHLGSQTIKSDNESANSLIYPDTKKWNELYNDTMLTWDKEYMKWLSTVNS